MKEDENMVNQTDILGRANCGYLPWRSEKWNNKDSIFSQQLYLLVFLPNTQIDYVRTVPRFLEILSCNLSKTLYPQSFNLLNVAINNKRGEGSPKRTCRIQICIGGIKHSVLLADNIKLTSSSHKIFPTWQTFLLAICAPSIDRLPCVTQSMPNVRDEKYLINALLIIVLTNFKG